MRTTLGSTRSSPCERHESVAHASVRGKRKHREIDRLEKGTYRTRPRRQASQLKITKSHAKAHSASCSFKQELCISSSSGSILGAVVTVPMGGQHVLLAIRIEHKCRIQSEDWLAGDRRTRGRLQRALCRTYSSILIASSTCWPPMGTVTTARPFSVAAAAHPPANAIAT